MYGCRYIHMYLLICYSLQFLQACGGACSIAPSIHIICQTIFVFKVYPKGRRCSQATSILKWLPVILPNYRNKLHAVNLFCVFVSCVVLMCRLITPTHDPVPSSPYRKRRVLCTGIEFLLWEESVSTLTDILIPMKTTFTAPKGKDVWRPELEPTSCLDGNSKWAQWGKETFFLCYPSISMQALVNKRQVWRNKN